ncbi:MAG: non-ribosomal peptide synthetase [Umezawaea sp.]
MSQSAGQLDAAGVPLVDAAIGVRPLGTDDVLDRFRRAVAVHPGRTAVVDSAHRIDFAELDRLTAQLAARLRARGVRRGDLVGISMTRGSALVVAFLAVWRAGAAYVPLDPDHPTRRLHFMATDAGVRHVLVRGGEPGEWPAGVEAVAVDGETPEPTAAPEVHTGPGDAAYVIYTSGSTGTPKGVVATRGGLAVLVRGVELAGLYPAEREVVAWTASMSFDASVHTWIRVCRGDTVLVVDSEQRVRPEVLAALFDEHGVDELNITPSHWDLIGGALLDTRRGDRRLRLVLGGEPVSQRLWDEIAGLRERGVDGVNLYGPTECTVEVTWARIDGAAPTIGVPLPGVAVHVLDEALRPVPEGQVGELFVGGPFVARGYLGLRALTAERFLPDPFAGNGKRMYRTGDRVRSRPDGSLEYAGRADRQVKVRGMRIELGEIESAMTAVDGVERAIVVKTADPTGADQLAGYFVPRSATAPTAAELAAHLATVLPKHLVPAVLTAIDAVPITVNGKADLTALPPVSWEPVVSRGDLAADVEVAWLAALEVDGPPDPAQNFFALGGDSVRALRLIALIEQSVGVAVDLRQVYRGPHLPDLVAAVRKAVDARQEGS